MRESKEHDRISQEARVHPCKGHYSTGYHYHSGFFSSPKGLLWYWMTGDDRDRGNAILFRRARHLKDYQGMTNQWPKNGEEFDHMIQWHDRHERPDTASLRLHKGAEPADAGRLTA